LRIVAVDLGASSGRVLAADMTSGSFRLQHVARFPNTPVRLGNTLHWDLLAIYSGILAGIRVAGQDLALSSIGIDSWGVDYGLLDASGELLGNPVHYRDPRTALAVEEVLAAVPPEELYARTGIQLLALNTVFQLVADRRSGRLAMAERVLLIPDLLGYFLTGVLGTEETNASTTGLLQRDGGWDTELMTRVGIDPAIFAPMRRPGDPGGFLAGHVLSETALAGPVPLTVVASHDTASAVAAVPAANPRFAYVSCGTWSLVGVELAEPVITEAGRRANFTNERGLDGTIRFLRNVMGLWLMQESMRAWERGGGGNVDLARVIADAAGIPALRSVIDVDDPVFLPPGDMPARIRASCRQRGEPEPVTRAEIARCILDSLALDYRRTVEQAQQLCGHDVEVLHLVGGGANNALLCQLTADACGVVVLAGPVEATAIGNVLVQARAIGALRGGLAEMRSVIREAVDLTTYRPVAERTKLFAEADSRLP